METDALSFTYQFEFENKSTVSFVITFDPLSHNTTSCPIVPPHWSRLENHQCSICQLLPGSHPYCPVALGIAELVTAFKDVQSFMPCKVSCVSRDRTVFKFTTVQEGISSILGLQMAVSGCPTMEFFRPMARFHLPFATVDESIFRVISCYLLRQFYKTDSALDNRHIELNLDEIKSHYGMVKLVNRGILERIRDISVSDADKNAIVTLSSLAQILEMEIDSNLESLTMIFR